MKNEKRSRYIDAFGMTEFLYADFTDFVYPPHVHDTFSIGVIERGAQPFASRAGREFMPEQKLCVIDPDVVHQGWSNDDGGWRYRMFYPAVGTVARLLDLGMHDAEQLGFGRFVLDDPSLFAEFRALHLLAMDTYDVLDLEERLVRFVDRLFSRHAGGQRREAPGDRSMARKCADFLDGHLDQNVSIEELAALSCVSKTQVIRAFTKAHGISPHAFQVARRVERAKKLLAEGESAGEVAVSCGFFDQSHLHRHFRRIVGVTPAAFQKVARM